MPLRPSIPLKSGNKPTTKIFKFPGKRHDLVRGIWFSAAPVVLIFPVLPWLLTVSMFATFLSFMTLDEYHQSDQD
ncbi:hypothetical protein [Pelagibaculum spongiae]|uniref:hypothetical protein n=1 Tax=Pelagibaculum spongiae TaxID=2080658 RepID=UPI001314E5B5|nr:hypothetical protein [Pelagibaculum spongiae]